MTQRLTDNHPLAKKADKLMGFLEENKLSISMGYGGLYIRDDSNGLTCSIKDVDDNTGVADLPAVIEYKLIIIED